MLPSPPDSIRGRKSPRHDNPNPPGTQRKDDTSLEEEVSRYARCISDFCTTAPQAQPLSTTLELRNISALSLHMTLGHCDQALEISHVRLFYNSPKQTAVFYMSSEHNANQSWMLTAINRMVQDGFIPADHLASHRSSDSDDETEDDGEEGHAPGLRTHFLLTVGEQPFQDFRNGFNDSVVKPDFVIQDERKTLCNFAVELGLSQGYQSNDRGTGLEDRINVLLDGGHPVVEAAVIVCIDEDKTKSAFLSRFSGFIELWRASPRANGEGAIPYCVKRVDLHSDDGLPLFLSDIYGGADSVRSLLPSNRHPNETFVLKAVWLRQALRAHFRLHLRNQIVRQAAQRRARVGDVGRNWSPYPATPRDRTARR